MSADGELVTGSGTRPYRAHGAGEKSAGTVVY